MDPLSLFAIISTLTGINLKDVMKLKLHRSTINIIGMPVVRLLSILGGNEELVGYWNVAKWDYLINKGNGLQDSGYHVYGNLAILFKYPNEERWKGTLVLTYHRKMNKKAITPKFSRFIEKKRGNFFQGVYDIELRKGNKECYIGTTTMIFRDPEIYRYYSGEFRELKLDNYGRLEGEFYNTGPFREAESSKSVVIFHQRKKWDEISDLRTTL